MVVVPVGEGYLCNLVEVPVHPQCVVQEGLSLSGVEQQRPAVPFHQGREAMLPEGPGERTDTVIAEDGDAEFHREPFTYLLVQQFWGNLGTPSLSSMVII